MQIVQLMVLLFIFCHAHAMEMTCHLNQMPNNVQNRIAHFLGWETKEAFIKRVCEDIKDKKRILYNNVISADKTKKAIFSNFNKAQYSELDVYHFQDDGNGHIIFNMLFDVGYKFTKLAFNQQGTILFVCYDYLSHKKLRLFKLNAIVDYETDRSGSKKEENALQNYLRYHLVCRKY